MIPVYNMLRSEVEQCETDLTDDQKKQLIANIAMMDTTGHELLYVLIRSYDKEITDKTNTLPFNSRIQKTGIKFELDNMDMRLKHIIYKFSDMHLKRVVFPEKKL